MGSYWVRLEHVEVAPILNALVEDVFLPVNNQINTVIHAFKVSIRNNDLKRC